jgi:hypothetical protein
MPAVHNFFAAAQASASASDPPVCACARAPHAPVATLRKHACGMHRKPHSIVVSRMSRKCGPQAPERAAGAATPPNIASAIRTGGGAGGRAYTQN